MPHKTLALVIFKSPAIASNDADDKKYLSQYRRFDSGVREYNAFGGAELHLREKKEELEKKERTGS